MVPKGGLDTISLWYLDYAWFPCLEVGALIVSTFRPYLTAPNSHREFYNPQLYARNLGGIDNEGFGCVW